MHMSHKKRASTALKSMGAAGLAAATIVSGLSFGAPAASAAPQLQSISPQATASGKFVMKLSTGSTYWAVRSDLSATAHSTLAAAKAAAATATFTTGTGQVKIGSSCIVQAPPGFNHSYTVGSCSSALQVTLSGRALWQGVTPIGIWQYTNEPNWVGPNQRGYQLATYDEIFPSTRTLTAQVTKVNNIAKSAIVSGKATPNGTVTIGSQTVNVNSSGDWSMTVTGLTVGANTLTAIQKVNNLEVDRKTVTATIVEGGTFVGVDQGPVELERGATTQLPLVVQNNQARTHTTGTVTVTAPEGTTFNGQTRVDGSWRTTTGSAAWSPVTSIPFINGRLSDDDKTITFDADWGATNHGAQEQYRYMLDVTTSEEAAGGDGEMAFTFAGNSTQGDFRAEGKTTTTLTADVASPTGTVTFLDDVTEKAVVTGTGVDGATITLFAGDSTTAIGTATVRDGTWSTTIDPIGPGEQKIRIEQSGIDGIQTAETTAQYGAAVVLDEPASSTVTPGAVTVTGTGTADTKVTVSGGAQPVTTTVRADGTFTAEVELAPSNTAKTLSAQQHTKGNLITSDTITVTPNGAQTAREVVITEPSSHTYRPNRATTISGTATPYATVDLRFQWNNTVYGTAKADINGNWSITRGFGPTAKYELTATQTRFDTTTSASAMFTLDPEGITNQEVVITGPADHAYMPGEQTRITGTSTPWASIELRFQWNDTVYGTAVANGDGEWNIVRPFGPSATYELTAKQLRPDGTTSLSNTFTLEATGIDRPFTLTTPAMASTFQPGTPVSFTGTGTRGATITAIAPAWNNNEIWKTEVDANGKWEIRRGFAGITYDLTLVQQPTEGEPSTITGVRLAPAS